MRASDKLNFNFKNTLSLTIQTDDSESALACLSMMLFYFDRDGDFNKLKYQYPISSSGTSVFQLSELAEKLGLNARVIKVENIDYTKLKIPSILEWGPNNFVILEKINNKGATLYDPRGEVINMTLAEFNNHFSGVAIELSPNVDFTPSHKVNTTSGARRFSWKRLIGSTVGLKKSLMHVVALAFALELSALLLPLVTQIAYDHVVVTGDLQLLTMLGLAMAFLQFIRIIINTLRAWSVMVMSATLNVQWITNVFSHLIRLPIAWFDKQHTGDISSRFESIHAIQGMVTTRSIEVGLDGILSVGVLIMMFFYNPTLAALVVAAVMIYFLLRMSWYRAERKTTEAAVIFSAQEKSLFLETLRSITTLRLFNASEDRKARWLNRLIAQKNADLRTQRIQIMTEMSYWILFGVESVAVLWIGALAVVNNEWSIGMMIAFIAYKDQFVNRSIGVVDKILEFKVMGIQAERLSGIVLVDKEKESPPRVNGETLEASLTIDKISFRHNPQDALVVNDCFLHVKAGESVAIVGASGCGKTTLLKMMIGLTEPESGEIRYGDKPISQIGTSQYRDLIGVVMQDDQLLSGTIAENISFFDSNPDPVKIEHSSKVAAVHQDILKMPMGYQTLVGDMGSTLSGGQIQRIFLARAIYKEPKVLFLDEATSHLDVSNETLVNMAIRDLNMTTIVIAHRPETIRMADRVILMEDGRVSEFSFNRLEELTQQVVAKAGITL